MNAIEIVEQVRSHRADLALVDDRLVVCGAADPLPDELRQALSDHKAELMIALGTLACPRKRVHPLCDSYR